MRKVYCLVVVVILIFIDTVDVSATPKPQDTLHVGVHYAPPLSYEDNSGVLRGFCIDLFEAVAEKAGWTVRFHYDAWPQIERRLFDGALDLVLPILYRADRVPAFHFSEEAMFTTWAGLITQRQQRIESLLQLSGKTIGGVEGDAFLLNLVDLLDRFGLICQLKVYPSSDSVYAAIQKGAVDAGVIERLDIHFNARSYGLVQSPVVFSPGTAHIGAVDNDMADVLSNFDRILGEMKLDADSRYYRLYDAWFGEDERNSFPGWLIALLQIGAVIIFFLLAVAVLFRHRLKQKTIELSQKNIIMENEISERLLAEKRMQSSLDEKTVLLKEIHHRVKNNLQIISSLLNLQSGSINDQTVQAVFKEGQQRIRTIALIHETLYKSSNFSRIPVNDFLQTLVKNLYKTYWHGKFKVDIRIETELDELEIDYAIPCGLIVTELVSNALKYAFSGQTHEPCSLAVALRHYNGDAAYDLELMVADNGVGLPEDLIVQEADSLGLRLITILAEEQLNGRMQILCHPGTAFNIQFPLKK